MVKWLKLGELLFVPPGWAAFAKDDAKRILCTSNRIFHAVPRICAFWLKSDDFSVDLER
jgi:hypothetical protein